MGIVHTTSFAQGYRRYIGSLGDELNAKNGMNASTHVASVCLTPNDPGKTERAVVKHFRFSDHGWANEYVAWTLAQQLGVVTAPRAALLIGRPSEVAADHGAELNYAVVHDPDPFVLWCTSAIEPTKPVQQVLSRSWERAVLNVANAQILAAFDAWIGNCDRAVNTLYWHVTGGGVVAIDHEKMVFAQDWAQHPPLDLDTVPADEEKAATFLLDALQKAKASTDSSTKRAARRANQKMYEASKGKHAAALSHCTNLIQEMVTPNFSARACQNLLTFLERRAADDSVNTRFGYMI